MDLREWTNERLDGRRIERKDVIEWKNQWMKELTNQRKYERTNGIKRMSEQTDEKTNEWTDERGILYRRNGVKWMFQDIYPFSKKT